MRDLKYWEAFLDMMVENRFNAISLWNHASVHVHGAAQELPRGEPMVGQELAEWQELYRGIFRMAKERGLDTYVVFWSIFVSRELAEAHGVARQNFYPHYYGPGDTSDIVRRYLRESVRQVLEEYPDLDGWASPTAKGWRG